MVNLQGTMFDKKLIYVMLPIIVIVVIAAYYNVPSDYGQTIYKMPNEPVFSLSPRSGSQLSSYVIQKQNYCSYHAMTELWAAVNGDPEICNILESSESISVCLDQYYLFSSVFGNDMCGMISDNDYRTLCEAVVSNDDAKCNDISPDNEKELKETCAGIINKDVSVCDRLEGDNMIGCSNLVRMFIARANNDITMCEDMVNFPGDMPDSQKNFCILFVQGELQTQGSRPESQFNECMKQFLQGIDYRNLENISSCYSLSGDSKMQCEAVVSKDSEACSHITEYVLRFRCYYQILGKEKLLELCAAESDFCFNQSDAQ